MPYEFFCNSVQGASHIKKGMPCEDYGLKYKTELSTSFAVADGHGDSNCPRSAIGAKYICEIATTELNKFAIDIKEANWSSKLFDSKLSAEIMQQLIACIFGKWVCAVNEHYECNPLTDDEKLQASEYVDKYLNGQQIEHVYGTTLICGLLTDEYLLLLQQGDGRCCVFDSNGDVSQPIPWDDRCFANVTTSVCDSDAVKSCRYYVINIKENPVIACVAGTDGVEDSFANMDKMHTYYRQLLEYASVHDSVEFEQYLTDTLPELSAYGSGDDTTICGFFDATAIVSLNDKFKKENEIVCVQDEISSADERIKSMTAKLAYLKQKYDVAVANYLSAEQSYQSVVDKYVELTGDDTLDMSTQDSEDSDNLTQASEEDVTASAVEESIDSYDGLIQELEEDTMVPVAEASTESNDLTQVSEEDAATSAEEAPMDSKELTQRLTEEGEQRKTNGDTPVTKKRSKKSQKEIDALIEKKDILAASLRKALEEKMKIEAEFLPYKEKYDGFVTAKEAAIDKMKKLKESLMVTE